jgi:alpha-tubulin suppressor-like RCC1 family protein
MMGFNFILRTRRAGSISGLFAFLTLSASLPVPIAEAAPMVTNTTPAAGATWVSEYAPVTATFSEVMDPATITASGFTLEKQVGVVAIASNLNHAVALKGDGTVVAWGRNDYGQTTVPLGLSDVVAVAAGSTHTVALKGNGTVVAWGQNDYGQTTVPAGLGGVMAISAEGSHTVALKRDGTVVAWGRSDYEQTAVPAGLSGVVAIAAGVFHTVALKGDGTVVAWGSNSHGQTTVPSGLSDVVAIATKYSHTVALKGDGTVVAWGWNGDGQTTVPSGLSNVVAIAAGDDHTVALKGDGTVVAWGSNSQGQTSVPAGLSNVAAIAAGGYHTVALKGDGSVVTWGLAPPGLSSVVAIDAGTEHAVALKSDGTVIAWGSNGFGQSTVPSGLSGVVMIAAGGYHTVALKGDGTVVAWGKNHNCQSTVPPGLSGVVAIAAGDEHTVALKGDGTVIAWGSNVYVPPGLSGVVAITAGDAHTVALKGDGTVVAWGTNYTGETTVPSGLSGVVAVTAGDTHTVALKGDGTVVAWGGNGFGQTTVPLNLIGVVAIAAGDYYTVALKGDGTVVAWGDNSSGQTTVPTGLNGVVDIAAGNLHTMALKGDGTVAIWNGNVPGLATVPPSLSFNSVTSTVNYNDSSRMATLTPDAPLTPGSVYRAKIFGRSSTGTPMAGSTSWDFTTGETLARFLVTPKAGPFGKISPALGQLAASGTTVDYTLTPSPGFVIDTVTGCDGLLSGNTYTTGLINHACTVQVSFRHELPLTAPSSMSVPVSDTDGSYMVSWGASVSSGVTYVLQEATDTAFLTDLRTVYRGTALSETITGRSNGKTYYYRVKVIKSFYADSSWAVADNGCVVTLPVPTVVVTSPVAGATSVSVNGSVTATFSEAMNPEMVEYYFGLEKQVGTVAIAAGGENTVALTGDGKVIAWGRNVYGNTTVPAGLNSVVAIAAGNCHTVALRGNGTLVAWGNNDYGQTTVPVGLSGVMAIAAGTAHTVALKSDGTVATWGDNSYGQSTVPVGLNGVVAIAARGTHTVALKDDGTVVAWGNNSNGQSTVPSGLSGVVAIAAGTDHTVALKGDGTVVAWGDNFYGQTILPANLSGVVAIAAGADHTVVLKGDGTVVAWGYNSYGQSTVPPGLSGVVAIAAGTYHTVALKGDGAMVAWGYNSYGQSTQPTSLSPLFDNVPSTVVYDDNHRMATLTPGAPLALSSIYRAKVFGYSAIGIPMASSHNWKFSTGEYLASFLVTPKAGLHGKISPALGKLAIKGTTANFTLTPDIGYAINTVTGCGGSLVGNIYTTGPISQACTVTATFRLIPAAAPASITVPAVDTDGSYIVTWGPSATADVAYVLQEATNSTFTTGLRQAYAGTGTSASITGRSSGKTYYYRVRAAKPNYTPSSWAAAGNGCGVTITCVAPASITVPAASSTGNYTVTWGTSTTAGTAYVLQEATNATFTAGLRQAYAGTGGSASITGRASGRTYYYRVRATRPGYTPSAWTTAGTGCQIGP